MSSSKMRSTKRHRFIKSRGPNRDSNPGPPPPEGGIMPLDHWDDYSPYTEKHIHNFDVFRDISYSALHNMCRLICFRDFLRVKGPIHLAPLRLER